MLPVNCEDVWRHLSQYPSSRVAYHHSPASKWVYATVETRDKDLSYNHRSILPNEVVLDLDAATEDENFSTLKKLSSRFVELGVKHSVWTTGGKGYHIHTFWSGMDHVAEPRCLKEKLFEWLTQGINGKFDRQLLGNHMVRLEGGKYEKAYPREVFKHMVGRERDHFVENDIPEFIWKDYRAEVLSYALRSLKPRQDVPKGSMPECVKYLLSEKFKEHRDGGQRAVFVLANWYHKMPDEELFALLKTFSQYNLREPLLDREIMSQIKRAKNHTGRRCGCRFRHSLLCEIGAKEIAERCESMR